MNREILDWTDKEFDKVLDEKKKSVKTASKAFGLGFIEGALDGLTMVGAVTMIGLGILAITGKKWDIK